MTSMAYCDINIVTLLSEMYPETLWLFISTMAHYRLSLRVLYLPWYS
jgi:hypothetical protein